ADKIKAAAPFYGGGIPIERTAKLKAPLLAFFGEDDPFIPLDTVEQLKAELARHRKDAEVVVYPKAPHGFFCNERDSYRPEGASRPRRARLRDADRPRTAAPPPAAHEHLLPSLAAAALPGRERDRLAADPGRDADRRHRLLARRRHRHRAGPPAARGPRRSRRHGRDALLPDALPARRPGG